MYRILLVDDEILVRDAIKENIDWKSMDCQLVGDCENGKQAADFVKSHPVDIVLTDILMPYMDGMELSHFLHDNYPEIVIVIFSGFGEFEYAKKAIQYNVSEYMLKPVTAMELREVIGKMKEKVDLQRKEKKKIESLTKTSQDYHKNALVIRSKAIESLVSCTRMCRRAWRNCLEWELIWRQHLIGLRYLTWICFPIFIRLIWKNAGERINGFCFI
ncbi:MAG: response regulator [Blautia marasmi]